jgi:hypothetical protein
MTLPEGTAVTHATPQRTKAAACSVVYLKA